MSGRRLVAAVIVAAAVGCRTADPVVPRSMTVTPSQVSLSGDAPSAELWVGYAGPAGSSLLVTALSSDARIEVSAPEVVVAAGGEEGLTVSADTSDLVSPLSGTLTFVAQGVDDVAVTVFVSGPAPVGCVIEPGAPMPSSWSPTGAVDAPGLDHVPGELLVTYHDTAFALAEADVAARRLLAAEVARSAGVTLLRAGAPGTHDLVLAPDGDVAAAEARLASDPRVRHVSRNYLARPLAVPQDAHYDAQWHLWDFGLEAVWEVEDAGGMGAPVVIAVVDDGLNTTHVDLVGKVLPGRDVYCNDDDVRSFFQHGTHVAGIAAAGSDAGGRAVGVAKGERARVVSVKVFADDSPTATLDSVVRGIRWAAQLETGDGAPAISLAADVVNLSLGFGRGISQGAIDTLQEAVDAVGNRGVLVVAAAGNDGSDEGVVYPARLDGVLAVGAVDWEFTRSGVSTHGDGLDLMAPGGTAPAAAVPDDVCGAADRLAVLSTWGPGDTDVACQAGTSMASAFVAGTAALLIANDAVRFRWDPEAVVDHLVATAVEPDTYTPAEFGHGLVCPDAVFGLGTTCTLPPGAFGP